MIRIGTNDSNSNQNLVSMQGPNLSDTISSYAP